MYRASSVVALVVALAVAVVALPLSPMAAQDSESAALTDYLHNHRLPAVGAQITKGEGGARSVMLYGFVATQLGFEHAEQRTRDYLHDPDILITNRIRVEPDLLASHRSGSTPAPSVDYSGGAANPPPLASNAPPPAEVGDIQQYQTQNRVNDPYGIPGQSSTVSGSTLLIPLIGGLIMYGALGGFASSHNSSPPRYYYPPRRTYQPPYQKPRPRHRRR
jgi:hypothetical protein